MSRIFQESDVFHSMRLLGSNIKGYALGFPAYLLANNGVALANGGLLWGAGYIPIGNRISTFNCFQSTLGNYTASAFNGVALYSINAATGLLTQIAISANTPAIWSTAAGLISVNFTAPVFVPEGVIFGSLIYNRSAEVTAPVLLQNPASFRVSQYDLPNSIKLFANSAGTAFPATIASSVLTNLSTQLYFYLT